MKRPGRGVPWWWVDTGRLRGLSTEPKRFQTCRSCVTMERFCGWCLVNHTSNRRWRRLQRESLFVWESGKDQERDLWGPTVNAMTGAHVKSNQSNRLSAAAFRADVATPRLPSSQGKALRRSAQGPTPPGPDHSKMEPCCWQGLGSVV